jgi:hypothetical protein
MNGTLRVATIYGEPQMRPGNTCYDHGVSPVDCGLQEKCPSASSVTSEAAFAVANCVGAVLRRRVDERFGTVYELPADGDGRLLGFANRF